MEEERQERRDERGKMRDESVRKATGDKRLETGDWWQETGDSGIHNCFLFCFLKEGSVDQRTSILVND